MQIRFQQRTVSLSIGEFSEFTDRPVSSGGVARGGGFWRAQVGQIWHQRIRRNLEQESAEATFEVQIAANWVHKGWTFQLQGRADQILRHPGGVTIREIKTTEFPLPAHDPDLRAAFPAYFLQLEAYRRLFPLISGNEATAVSAELVFVEIQSGMTQTVPLEGDENDSFLSQLERLYSFVERRRAHLERLRDFSFNPPFPAPDRDRSRSAIECRTPSARKKSVSFKLRPDSVKPELFSTSRWSAFKAERSRA